MKRLFIFLFLFMLLFNWIGYQLYTTIADQYSAQSFSTPARLNHYLESEVSYGKIPDFHIALYNKEIDFDDLWEFAGSHDRTPNEIYFDFSGDLFPDRATNEHQRATFKSFNGEYYSETDHLLKYPDASIIGGASDRYLLNIPVIFISTQSHPPQLAA